MKRKRFLLFALATLALGLLVLLDLSIGSARIPLADTLATLLGDPPSPYVKTVILDYRLPKLVTAILVGISLSVSGLLMQTYFSNPLAGPYVLGVSSGASLGAAVALLAAGRFVFATALPITMAAWAGAMGMLALVMLASARLRGQHTILVMGIMLGAVATSGVSILQLLAPESALKSFVIWSMGSLAHVSGGSLALLGGAVLVGLVLSAMCVRPLDLLLLGPEVAGSMGLSVKRTQRVLFLATSLMTATATALCGPIGFVGIAVPHVARMLAKSASHGLLLSLCLLLGPIALLLADIISQLPALPVSLPINAVAALLGLPIVIQLLLQRSR